MARLVAPQPLQAGHNDISIQSVKGTCYVLLRGTRVVIDNLRFARAPTGTVVPVPQNGGTPQAGNAILHVDGQSGQDSNNGHSRASAFATVQKAISMAEEGDTVVVWPGVYQEEIRFEGKAITVQSAADAAVITAPHGYAFSFYDAEGPETVLTNFVITGCGVAGIFCDFGSAPTLRNLTITGNKAGVVVYGGANPYVVNSIIWETLLDNCRLGKPISTGASTIAASTRASRTRWRVISGWIRSSPTLRRRTIT